MNLDIVNVDEGDREATVMLGRGAGHTPRFLLNEHIFLAFSHIHTHMYVYVYDLVYCILSMEFIKWLNGNIRMLSKCFQIFIKIFQII